MNFLELSLWIISISIWQKSHVARSSRSVQSTCPPVSSKYFKSRRSLIWALSGSLTFTVQRHKFNTDSLSLQPTLTGGESRILNRPDLCHESPDSGELQCKSGNWKRWLDPTLGAGGSTTRFRHHLSSYASMLGDIWLWAGVQLWVNYVRILVNLVIYDYG